MTRLSPKQRAFLQDNGELTNDVSTSMTSAEYLTTIKRLQAKIPQLLIDTTIIIQHANDFKELKPTLDSCEEYLTTLRQSLDDRLTKQRPS